MILRCSYLIGSLDEVQLDEEDVSTMIVETNSADYGVQSAFDNQQSKDRFIDPISNSDETYWGSHFKIELCLEDTKEIMLCQRFVLLLVSA